MPKWLKYPLIAIVVVVVGAIGLAFLGGYSD